VQHTASAGHAWVPPALLPVADHCSSHQTATACCRSYYIFNPTPNPKSWPLGPYPFLWREFLVIASFGVGLFIIHPAVGWARARAAKKNGGRCLFGGGQHEAPAPAALCLRCMSPLLPPQHVPPAQVLSSLAAACIHRCPPVPPCAPPQPPRLPEIQQAYPPHRLVAALHRTSRLAGLPSLPARTPLQVAGGADGVQLPPHALPHQVHRPNLQVGPPLCPRLRRWSCAAPHVPAFTLSRSGTGFR
jgi:hypothetical protein